MMAIRSSDRVAISLCLCNELGKPVKASSVVDLRNRTLFNRSEFTIRRKPVTSLPETLQAFHIWRYQLYYKYLF